MRNARRRDTEDMADNAAFQVIVLGPTGGPREDNVTGILVRSTSTQWSSNSLIAVDAGTLLAGIIRTLERSQAESNNDKYVVKGGSFAGLTLPCKTPQANGAHVFREILGAVLVTHPHLDHLSGLAINTPMLEAGNGPKSLTALPSVVTAIKSHMFNDVIWPNLSDEDGGAGLLTYQRLVEGGNPRFGRGDARGYVRACNGLLTKCLSVSHGRCRQRCNSDGASHRRVGSAVFAADPLMVPSRGISVDHTDGGTYSPAPSPCLVASNTKDPVWTTVESSAFFIRDHHSGNEIIVFGDVEPDSMSLDPRNRRVWEVAAPKVAAGTLRAIFIECSYDDSIDDSSLYGHLCPRHLISELSILAVKVEEIQQAHQSATGKRKRDDSPHTDRLEMSPKSKRAQSIAQETEMTEVVPPSRVSTRSRARSGMNPNDSLCGTPAAVQDEPSPGGRRDDVPLANDQRSDPNSFPLMGLSVYIIHIKDNLTDGPPPGDRILQELKAQGDAASIGCEFFIPKPGEGIWI